MLTLSILASAALASAPIKEAPVARQDDPHRTIILFGARWCAPCMLEYRELPEFVRAAAPDRISLAWIDRSILPPPHTDVAVHSLSSDDARRLARKIGGEGYGLPLSAMVNANGQLCAVWHRRLLDQDLGAMRARCDIPKR